MRMNKSINDMLVKKTKLDEPNRLSGLTVKMVMVAASYARQPPQRKTIFPMQH